MVIVLQPTVSYSILPYSILQYLTMSSIHGHCTTADSILQYLTIQYLTIQYLTVSYHTVSYSILPCPVFMVIVLQPAVSYSILPYSILQYLTIQYLTVSYHVKYSCSLSYSRQKMESSGFLNLWNINPVLRFPAWSTCLTCNQWVAGVVFCLTTGTVNRVVISLVCHLSLERPSLMLSFWHQHILVTLGHKLDMTLSLLTQFNHSAIQH